MQAKANEKTQSKTRTKKKTHPVLKALQRLFIGTGLALTTMLAGPRLIMEAKADKFEDLTKKEKVFLKDLFGNAVDTTHLRKIRLNEHYIGGREAIAWVLPTGKNDMYFYKDYYADEFTADYNNLGYLVHETNHIVENQSKTFPRLIGDIFSRIARGEMATTEEDYALNNLSPHKSFDEYKPEQRAEMVEYYANVFVLRYVVNDLKRAVIRYPEEKGNLIRDIVEAKYPRAKQTRLKNEQAPEVSPKKDLIFTIY